MQKTWKLAKSSLNPKAMRENKLRHLVLFLSFRSVIHWWNLILFNEYNRIASDATLQVDMIKFGNRFSFLIVGAIIPMIHLWGIAEYFWPTFIKQNTRIISFALIACLFLLLSAGFAGSVWIKSKVEDEGYIYCGGASGVSALSRSLVYVKDIEICDELSIPKSHASK